MGTKYNPSVVRNGLIFYLDAANTRCYSGSGNTVLNLALSAQEVLQNYNTTKGRFR
jgi:hypothetical protein